MFSLFSNKEEHARVLISDFNNHLYADHGYGSKRRETSQHQSRPHATCLSLLSSACFSSLLLIY